jgi:hypothetical protein
LSRPWIKTHDLFSEKMTRQQGTID